MREIKFRAIRISDNKVFNNLTLEDFDCWYCIPAETIEVDIVLYTWLKDKNLKEIYEWDILSNWDSDSMWTVVWDEFSYPNVCETNWDICCSDPLDGVAKDMEIIWNIYENPELINNK